MPKYYENHAWLVSPAKFEAAEAEHREVLARSAVTSLDKQRRTVAQIKLTPVACPACSLPVNQVAAAIAYRELYDACEATERDFACPCCGLRLIEAIPFIAVGPGYHWLLALADGQLDLLRDTIADFVDVEEPA